MSLENYKMYEPIDGKWYINKELGKGAFGIVLEVERRDFSSTRSAMKIITIPSSESELESFKQEHYDLDEESITSYFYGFVEDVTKEFKIMSQLRGHSNIISFEDYNIEKHIDDIGWDIFIRMELLTPMNKYFAEHSLTTKDVIKLGIDICKALEVCSKYNIIHRDIKPANIFISGMGEFKLGDFGIARTLEKTTGVLSQKGTYTYMAPEVYKGEEYGPSVDLYSLGIVMYRLLNNNHEPFRTNMTHGDMQNAFALRMSGAEIPKPANADDKLAAIVLKACSYDPKDRFESPVKMREALERILDIDANESMSYENNNIIDFEPSKTGKDTSDEATEVMVNSHEVTENKINKKPFLKKTVAWGIASLIAVIALVFAFFLGGGTEFAGDDGKPVLVLVPDTEMTDDQMQVIEKNLKARTDLFEGNAKLKNGKDNFQIVIEDKSVFGRTAEERNYNLDLLTSRGNFRVILGYGGWISDFGKEGITDVTLETESLDKFRLLLEDKMNDEIKKSLSKTETEEIYYIHVKLNSQSAMYFRDCIDKAKEKETYLETIGNVDYADGSLSSYDELGYAIDINPDGSEFYLLPTYFDSKFTTNLLYTVLNGDELPCFLTSELSESTTWEVDEAVLGKNQVTEMKGKLIAIEAPYDVYVSSYDDKTSDEKFTGFVKELKKRLDKLNTDYMIGYKGIDLRTLVVKLSPEVIGSDYIRLLLSQKSIDIHSQYRNIYADIQSMQTALDPEGNICLKVNVKESKEELIKEYNSGFNWDFDLDETAAEEEQATESDTGEEKYIYLVVNDVTIANAELSKVDGNTIYFSNFLCFNDNRAKDEDISVLDLICAINDETEYYSCTRQDLKVWYCEDGEKWVESTNIPWKYEAKSDVDKAFMSKIQEMGYEVTKSYTMRSALDIDLEIKENSDFAKNFVSSVKEIYTACDFDSGSYHMVWMTIKGETDISDADRARIVVNKDSTSNAMTLVGIFTGPTYKKYASEIDSICKNDEFFVQRGFSMMNMN